MESCKEVQLPSLGKLTKPNKSIKVLPAKQYLIIFAMKVEEKCDVNAGLAAVNLIKSLVIEQEELHRFSQSVLVFISPNPVFIHFN